MRAEISADARQYIQAIDRAIDANQRFGKSVGLTDKEIEKQDKRLNQVRGGVSQTTTETTKATEAQKGFNRSLADSEGNLSRTRYALYDVATSYAAISAATLGAVAATGTFAAKYETAFTEIERTTLSATGQVSSNVDSLREQFLDLSEVIPLTFEELTKIGSIGAQLGIAEDQLISFTETVAQFSRLSGVSAEQSALAFGRIGELLNVSADQYVNLGSAIAATAVSAAATDAQIIALTKELAAGAAGAGLTADAVVGLSSTLASLGVAPERARGALSTYFGTLNKAVAEGGEDLENFATIVGVTSEELTALVRNGRGEDVLKGFIAGLSELNNVAKTTALDELGLSQLRVEDTFRRLSQNVGFFNEQLDISQNAYSEGTFLADAYAVVLDDVASQFQLLLNSIGRFLATAGQPFLEFLRVALPLAADFLNTLSEFAATDAGEQFFRVAGGITALIGALTAVRAVASLATASTFALVTANQVLGGTGLIANIRAMAGAVAGIGTSAGKSATTVGLLTAAFTRLFRATVVLALIAGAFDLVFNSGQGVKDVFEGLATALLTSLGGALDYAVFLLDDVVEGFSNIVTALYNIERAFPILGVFLDGLQNILATAIRAGDALARMWDANGRARTLGNIPTAERGNAGRGGRKAAAAANRDPDGAYWERYAEGLSNAEIAFDDLGDASVGAADGIGGAGDAAADTAEKIRTLVDYANDLSGVFNRAFDLRFGTQLAVDGIADQWDALADRIRQARMEIQGLTAERNVKEYFLSVADAYGDELRAGKLRAEIGEINEKIADTQADASTELEGNSKAARGNRKVLSDLAKGYEDYIVQLAESGADQATLNAAVAKSEAEFIKQARALGFSNAQIQPYINSFRGLTTVINAMPRNITIQFNADPAIQAMREFADKADAANRAVQGLRSAGSSPLKLSTIADLNPIVKQINAEIALREGRRDAARAERLFAAANEQQQAIYALQNARNRVLSGYAGGGYTGRGGKYEPAGIVHRGEYVVPKSQVNQSTGLPYADALGGLKSGSRPAQSSYASGGFVSGGMGIVELGPKSLNAVREIARKEVILAIDSREIARASANGSRQITQEGGRL